MNHYPVATLGDVCDIAAGGTPSRSVMEYFGGDIPWVKIGDLAQGKVTSTEERITQRGLEGSAAKLFPAGTVLISIFATIGRTAVLGIDAATNQAIAGITPRDARRLDSVYLRHYFDSITATLVKSARGVAQLNINLGILKALPLPLPPLPEQRRIAAILDQADALRAKRREALAQLDSLTQSIFVEMFGDPVVNPKAWEFVSFGSVGTLDRGVSKSRPRNAPELLGGPYPLIQTGDVSNCDGYIRQHSATYSETGLRQSKLWPVGTLCITIAANIAKTGILTFAACFPDSVVGFNAAQSATVEYVRVWLSFLQKALEDAAPESAQKNINLSILRDLRIPVPPLCLQQTFATRIKAVESLKTTHRAALAEMDTLFASLQHRAFAGQLS